MLPNIGVTAGYGDEVIFADGTFIDGSTAEVSADGPMRPPYVVYCQVSDSGRHIVWVTLILTMLQSVITEGHPHQRFHTRVIKHL